MGNPTLLHFLASVLAGWVNRHQEAIIDYPLAENRVFGQQLQGRRLHLSDNDRRRLAPEARFLGRRVLEEVAIRVTPDTLLAWSRNLIAHSCPGHRTLISSARTQEKTGGGALILEQPLDHPVKV